MLEVLPTREKDSRRDSTSLLRVQRSTTPTTTTGSGGLLQALPRDRN